MREITVSAYNAIEAERNSLQEEMVGLRRRNAELEKEARRAATLERELEREQRLHAQRKERHQAAVVETGRLDQKVREQDSLIRHLEEQVDLIESYAAQAERARHDLDLSREEVRSKDREIDKLRATTISQEQKILELFEKAQSYDIIKGALK